MSKIVEMQKKRAELAKNMRNLVDLADAETGLSAEQEGQWKKMETDLSNLDASIDREKQLETIENSLGQLEDEPHRPAPHAGANANPLAGDEYKNSFIELVRNGVTPDIRAALEVGTDSEGGYLVPQAWVSTLIDKLTDNVVMRQLGSIMSTSSTTNLPLISDKGAAAWLDEEAAYSESDIAFGNTTLAAYKLGRIIKVSEELLSDNSFNLEGEIARIFGETFGTAEETAFVTGDGTGKPTGVLTTATNGVTAAGVAAITYDELVDLIHSVREVYRSGASFLMKDSTCALLRKLKSSDGVPLWQPSLQAGAPDMFLGYSVRTSEAMPAATTGLKSVAFGDFSQYRIADRGGIAMQRLNELYAGNGQVGFRMRKRVDGKLLVAEAVKTLTQA